MPAEKYLDRSENKLVLEETSYPVDEMIRQNEEYVRQLNSEQKKVYDNVIDSVNKDVGGFFFVYGSGGCGKTFLWKTIITKL